MTISFRCSNPECNQPMRAPAGTEGKKARCPLCETVQVIPLPQPADEPIPMEQPPGEAAGLCCGECGRALPPKASLCLECGWVNPAAMGGPPVPLPAAAAAPAGESMEIDCFKAITYGASNINSIVKLVLYSLVLIMVLDIFRGFFMWLIFLGPLGMLIFVLATLACGLVVDGYFLRFYLDCVISSLEGADEAPNVPEFDLKVLFMTGLKGLGVLGVYVLPVVTIPLLPLALLAWGYSDDMRVFNVPWAFRAAAKKPGKLLMVWLIMILWGAAEFGFLWVAMLLTGATLLAFGGGFFSSLIIIAVAGLVLSAIFHMFNAVLFRCIGMLGLHNKDLLEMLPPGKE